ncbi:MAG: hypothetical protein M0P91_07400 [Sulfuricurvum sp.]|jgi:hypothetical protein|uniref:hypothetical protein n=1 Tax=Sulfuricurvum sp. TaxID=2025608 RepID=UPI0025DD8FD0|nr:hypothetical protein [Sulfuricurvum sp.]MCK9373007.1 hypothetical protein [Sulfuricurvum sp.]
MSADITHLSNNNYLKQNIFTYISKSDTINNYFYLLNLNQREAAAIGYKTPNEVYYQADNNLVSKGVKLLPLVL